MTAMGDGRMRGGPGIQDIPEVDCEGLIDRQSNDQRRR